MKKGLLIALLAILSINAHAVRLPTGELANPGDNVNKLYKAWGNPDFNVSSERTCGKVVELKKTYCSTSRKVWKRGNEYWLVQLKRGMIIKIKWTRNKRYISKKF